MLFENFSVRPSRVVLERVLIVLVEEHSVTELTDMVDVPDDLFRIGAVAVRVVAQEEALDPGGNARGAPVVPCVAGGRVGCAAREQGEEETE